LIQAGTSSLVSQRTNRSKYRMETPLLTTVPGSQRSIAPASTIKASWITTTVNLTKAFVGASSFEVPWAFAQAGLVGSIMGILAVALVSTHGLCTLARCSALLLADTTSYGQPPSYPSLGAAALGQPGHLMAWFGLGAMTLGVCGSYVTLISTTLADLTGWSSKLWVLLVFPPLVATSCIRRMNNLRFTSAFGTMALVAAVAVTTYDAAVNEPDRNENLLELPLVELDTFPLFIGNIGFLYLISTAILPIAQSMHEPARFDSAFTASVVFVTILNLSFGIFAWYRFGGSACKIDDHHVGAALGCVQSNVLKNLEPGVVTRAVKALVVVDIINTCAIFTFPMNEALTGALLGEGTGRLHYWKGNALRAIVIASISAIAYFLPFFPLLTGLTGGLGNNILGLILPPVFYFRLQLKRGYWKRSLGSYVGGTKGTDTPEQQGSVWELVSLAGVLCFGLAFLGLTLFSFGKAIWDQLDH